MIFQTIVNFFMQYDDDDFHCLLCSLKSCVLSQDCNNTIWQPCWFSAWTVNLPSLSYTLFYCCIFFVLVFSFVFSIAYASFIFIRFHANSIWQLWWFSAWTLDSSKFTRFLLFVLYFYYLSWLLMFLYLYFYLHFQLHVFVFSSGSIEIQFGSPCGFVH